MNVDAAGQKQEAARVDQAIGRFGRDAAGNRGDLSAFDQDIAGVRALGRYDGSVR